jgi:hypothetical protein
MWMTDSDSGLLGAMSRRGRGIFIGAIFIAWGIIGAVVSYVGDTDSLDIVRVIDASQNAIVHAVLWIAIGGGFIAWYAIGPGSSQGDGTDDNDNDDDDEERRNESRRYTERD